MKLSGVNKIYHNKNSVVCALKDIDLVIENCGISMILGSSGCGKTTLLNIIAGKDTDYEGSVSVTGRVETIDQQILLFEAMSVYDNLLLVSEDTRLIDTYLEQFSMSDFKRQKIKNLSIGQKQRIQIIRSLLMQPSILLCDEPTAGLDHDNIILIMDELKKISHDICVLIVTHEVSLADIYADCIIRMDNGQIIEEVCIHENKNMEKSESKLSKKSLMKHIKISFKQITTRKVETIIKSTLFFLFLILFSIFSLYSVASTALIEKNAWAYGNNLLVSYPINDEKENGNAYLYYDMYDKNDIMLVKDNIEGIIGYRCGWDEKYSLNNESLFPELTLSEAKEMVLQAEQELKETGKTRYAREYELCKQKIAYIEKKYPNNSYPENQGIGVFDYSIYAGFTNQNYLPVSNWDCYLGEFTQKLLPYQIFDNHKLEMMYGEIMDEDDEIVLSYTTAEKMAKALGVDIKNLVGQEYTLRLFGPKEDIKELQSNTAIAFDYMPVSTFKISGIFYYGNKNENQIFFKEGVFDSLIESYYSLNSDYLHYQYLSFLVADDMNTKNVASQINSLLGSEKSRFIQSYQILLNQEIYEEASIFYLYAGIGCIVILVLYAVLLGVSYTRMNKENALLRRYGYIPIVIRLFNMMICLLLSLIFVIVLMPYINEMINTVAHAMKFAFLMDIFISMILLNAFIVFILFVLVEGGYYVIGIKKYH